MTTETHTERIRQVFESINDRDWDRYLALHTAEAAIHGWEADLEPDDWVQSMRDHTLPAFPDLRYHIDELFAVDERVVMRYHVTGTHRGLYRGLEASGNDVTYPGIAVFRVEAGLVAEVWPVFDNGVLLEQIGGLSVTQ